MAPGHPSQPVGCGDPWCRVTGRDRAERFIRTLQANLLLVRTFATIEALRFALLELQRTYTEQWMLAKHD